MDNKIVIGDNCKVLNSSDFKQYLNKVRIIYIDPPYNTLSKKSYNDSITSVEWKEKLTNVLIRLFDYLNEQGVIFISIDDSEFATLKGICDSVFNKENFVGTFITKQSQRSNSKHINTVHEYILCYAKNKDKLPAFSVRRVDIPEQKEMIYDIINSVKKSYKEKGLNSAELLLAEKIKFYCYKNNITWIKNYNCVDENGDVFFASDLSVPSSPRKVSIPEIGLYLEPLKTRGWVSDEKFITLFHQNLLVFRDNRPYIKKFLIDARDNAPSILNFYSRQGTNDLNKLGLRDIFDTPKPVELIKFLIRIANPNPDDIVLDCYAGSGTTAQAVIEVNQEDNKS